MLAEGWRSVADVPVEVAKQFDPNNRAWISEWAGGLRAIVFDVGEDWWRAISDSRGNVHYQRWERRR